MSKALKSYADPMVLAKNILENPIQIKTGELISASPALMDHFFGRGIPDYASVRKVRHSQAEGGRGELGGYLREVLYTASCPVVRVLVAGKYIPGLIDGGAEVTVISHELATDLGLPVTESTNLQMYGV
jgi:hypothetical protein